MTVLPDRETPRGATIGVLEIQLDLVLEVASSSRRPSSRPRARVAATARAAEERVEEIGERIGVAEHLPHFFFRHRPEAAAGRAAADIDVPRALRPSARAAGARLLVHPPVGAKL